MRQIVEKQEQSIIDMDELKFSPDKIYILRSTDNKDMYKLSRENSAYTFISLNSSSISSHGTGNASGQIKQALDYGNVYEFDSFDDFVNWYIDNRATCTKYATCGSTDMYPCSTCSNYKSPVT